MLADPKADYLERGLRRTKRRGKYIVPAKCFASTGCRMKFQENPGTFIGQGT
jgi:hypothetical protein